MGVASKIMISSDYFKGSFYVIFPSKTFLTLYEKVVGDHYEVINDENRDFAGELANIIYGHSKKVFSESGLNLDMAIPSVHRAAQIESELVVVIPFKSSIGNFYIAVAPGEL
jgi:CheY-specific phosphatase CheX